MLMCIMQTFKWTIGMVENLLRTFGEFKANMEYRNVEFNADEPKQYEAERKATARKCSSGDVDLFGTEETTALSKMRGASEKRVHGKSQARESAN